MGLHKIVSKIKNPTWTPPASIRREHREEWGSELPKVVPAGPSNPLGTRKMGLDVPGYLIHGTSKPDGVGARVSHGCIRMHNADIEELFSLVPNGEEVRIVNQPIKIGLFANSLFMEAHAPFEEPGLENLATLDNAIKLLQEKASGVLLDFTDTQRLQQTITRGDGMVLEISAN
jgi:L,D-transpeptidase ErfK/SrfK